MEQEYTNPISEFVSKKGRVTLFAGAGVGAATGLPTWEDLLIEMANVVRKNDPHLFHVIQERINDGNYESAAEMYFHSKMPEGDRYAPIREKLRHEYISEEIRCLARIPFDGIITTNYDSTLNDAYAAEQGKSAEQWFYPDPSLLNAMHSREFFVARIHGRIEDPQHIVMTERGYEKLKSSTNYREVLHYFFTQRNLLFIGYSFMDPAIQHVMETVVPEVAPVQNGQHAAVIPENSDKLSHELNKLNISVYSYNSENGHRALWDMVCEAARDLSEKDHKAPCKDPFSMAKEYFATCYARYSIKENLGTLLDIVLEGIIITELEKVGGVQDISNFTSSLSSVLPVRANDVENEVRGKIFSLIEQGKIDKQGSGIQINGASEIRSMQEQEILAEGLRNRINLEDSNALVGYPDDVLHDAIEHLVLRRGGELSSNFSAHEVPDYASIQEIFHGYSFPVHFPKKRLIRAFESLISSSEPRESRALSSLSKVAFGLEMVMNTPRTALSQEKSLPEYVFLDANILMPILIEGHPYHSAYKNSLSQLKKSVQSKRRNLRVFAHRIALNEIVSHRRNAIRDYNSFVENEGVSLESKVLYEGLQNMNVFVAGFAAKKSRDETLSFHHYLQEFAPYADEVQLEEYVKKNTQIDLVGNLKNMTGSEGPAILHALEGEYSNKNFWEKKGADLIRHDAMQLAEVNSHLASGKAAYFVTADKNLRNAVSATKYSYLSNFMISHVGLLNLTQLVSSGDYENDIDASSTVKLMWGVTRNDAHERLRSHFVHLALREYDSAMASHMGDVVDSVAEDAIAMAQSEGINLDSDNHANKRRFERLLGDFENYFFRKLRSDIEQREVK